MTEAVLGIDVGTSGVRIAARDHEGQMLAMAQAPIMAPTGNFGRTLQDANLWWEAVTAAFARLDLKNINILAIAIDGTSGTILPVNAGGDPLGLASMYNDLAEPELVRRIASVSPESTAARGGTSPLARALMMDKGFTRILHQADWLAGKFCGNFETSDENNALKSGYDPVARRWPAWITGTGIDPAWLPKVVPAGTAIGKIKPGVAAQFKLPQDTQLIAGTTDGCAAFLASGANEPGDGVTSLGTTLTLKLLSANPVFAPQFGIYAHRIGNQWLAGGASNSGGAVLAKEFTKEKIAKLTAEIDPEVPTGLDFYPLPAPGERFPINDPNMQPRMLPRPEDERIYFHAILEGIAAVEARAYARLAELGASPLKSIRTVGGGAANEKWAAIRLRALKVSALAAASEHAAMGVARLAWRGLGHAD